MKEHPILFSTEMVKAILDGRKTQTRRIIKNAPGGMDLKDLYEHSPLYMQSQCPFGKPGDLLWVRETFAVYLDAFLFKADEPHIFKGLKYKPSIHMPKDYARIWLQVADIRVERLHEISEQDAIAEGIEPVNQAGVIVWKRYDDYYQVSTNPVVSFWSLWANIHSEESWNANPWVWVVSFKVLSTTGKPQL